MRDLLIVFDFNNILNDKSYFDTNMHYSIAMDAEVEFSRKNNIH